MILGSQHLIRRRETVMSKDRQTFEREFQGTQRLPFNRLEFLLLGLFIPYTSLFFGSLGSVKMVSILEHFVDSVRCILKRLKIVASYRIIEQNTVRNPAFSLLRLS
jgi:hypothetical protein